MKLPFFKAFICQNDRKLDALESGPLLTTPGAIGSRTPASAFHFPLGANVIQRYATGMSTPEVFYCHFAAGYISSRQKKNLGCSSFTLSLFLSLACSFLSSFLYFFHSVMHF